MAIEPRVRRGRPPLTAEQKVQRALERCVSHKPMNGRTDIGMCKCHSNANCQVVVPGRGRVRLVRLILYIAGKIKERELWRGTKYVLHDCKNRYCINPDHLRIGSHEENVNDMVRDLGAPMVLKWYQIRHMLKRLFVGDLKDMPITAAIAELYLTDTVLLYDPRGAHRANAKRMPCPDTLMAYAKGEQRQLRDRRARLFKQMKKEDPYLK